MIEDQQLTQTLPTPARVQNASPIHLLSHQVELAGTTDPLALIAPQPPRLSQHVLELEQLEASGIFSNYGPVNTRLEDDLVQTIFGEGNCVTVCNATIGLMLAIREVVAEDRPATCRYALMPSFTFAATAQAALWCGLTPLFYDVDPDTWLPSQESELALLREYAGQIAVIVPYATFGNNLDLPRYQRVAEALNIPIVVDAAASLGSLDERGRAFGAGFPWPVVFSMHATKAFSVGEGGFIYCADSARIARLRAMGGFGFGQERSATTIGLNSKMSEVTALTARLQLRQYGDVLARREALAEAYTRELRGEFTLQVQRGQRQVRSFQSVLLPSQLAPLRSKVIEQLKLKGVGAGTYFSPHLAQQSYFLKTARSGPLPITEALASRVLSLPLRSSMTAEHVSHIAAALRQVTQELGFATAASTGRNVFTGDFAQQEGVRAA